MYVIIAVMIGNVKIMQCTIFGWNPWTTNWIRQVWSRGSLILGHSVHIPPARIWDLGFIQGPAWIQSFTTSKKAKYVSHMYIAEREFVHCFSCIFALGWIVFIRWYYHCCCLVVDIVFFIKNLLVIELVHHFNVHYYRVSC